MSVPSSQLRQEMGAMISDLLQQCGLQLLEQPLRLEGWLRDIYPEHRAPVSVAIEALQTQCHLESGAVQDVSARLAALEEVSANVSSDSPSLDVGSYVWNLETKAIHHTIGDPTRVL